MIKDLNNKSIIKSIKESLINGKSYYEDWYESITAKKRTYVRVLFKKVNYLVLGSYETGSFIH